MDPAELEGLALIPYQVTGIDPEDPPPLFDLVRAYLGVRVERPANMPGPRAQAFRVNGQDRVAVRAGLPVEVAHFLAAHELAHVVMRRAGHPEHADEGRANYLGAALLMPRAFVRAVYRAEGFSPRALAEAVVCSQTSAVLRFGEVRTAPLAAVSPGAVRVRGPEAFVWPDEGTIRRWAARPGPGLARVRLTDQPRRVALVANDD
jgi:hypothetical protein